MKIILHLFIYFIYGCKNIQTCDLDFFQYYHTFFLFFFFCFVLFLSHCGVREILFSSLSNQLVVRNKIHREGIIVISLPWVTKFV